MKHHNIKANILYPTNKSYVFKSYYKTERMNKTVVQKALLRGTIFPLVAFTKNIPITAYKITFKRMLCA